MHPGLRFAAPVLLLLLALPAVARPRAGDEPARPGAGDEPARPGAGDHGALRPAVAPAGHDEADEAEADDEADDGDDDDGADEQAVQDDGAGELTADVDAGKRTHPHGGCPAGMVRVREFCVDRYEAPNRRGAKPLVMQSANDAVAWCTSHRKRLCTEDEWMQACEGDEHRSYPYAGQHVDGRCNDDKPWRQVDEGTLAKWPSEQARAHAKDLYQAARSGTKRKCVSQDGVRDLTGNVEEWVVRSRDHANDWPYLLVGCYWSGCYGGGKPTCHSTNDAHGPEFRFYETGFRCCKETAKGTTARGLPGRSER